MNQPHFLPLSSSAGIFHPELPEMVYFWAISSVLHFPIRDRFLLRHELEYIHGVIMINYFTDRNFCPILSIPDGVAFKTRARIHTRRYNDKLFYG